MPVLTSAHGSNVLLVASRHSARGSGVRVRIRRMYR